MIIRTLIFSTWLIVCWTVAPLVGQVLTVPLIERTRSTSENHIRFRDLKFSGSAVRLAGFKLALGSSPTQLHHAFDGRTTSGQPLHIPFSEVIAFKRVRTPGVEMILEIDRFPDISSADLLQIQPSCDDLTTKYRHTVRLVMPKDARLAWFGGAEENEDVDRLGLLSELQEENTVRIGPSIGYVWWAVPSIAKDPKCFQALTEPLTGSATLK